MVFLSAEMTHRLLFKVIINNITQDFFPVLRDCAILGWGSFTPAVSFLREEHVSQGVTNYVSAKPLPPHLRVCSASAWGAQHRVGVPAALLPTSSGVWWGEEMRQGSPSCCGKQASSQVCGNPVLLHPGCMLGEKKTTPCRLTYVYFLASSLPVWALCFPPKRETDLSVH